MAGLKRNAARSLAWPALRLSLTFSKLSGANPAYHSAAHHAAFSASAFCKVQLILRSCGCGVAERGAECPAHTLRERIER